MTRDSIRAALFAIGLAAVVLASSALMPATALAQNPPPQPQVPSQCKDMTFDRVVYMTSPTYVSFAADRQLVFAPSGVNATVGLFLAHDSCIVAADGRLNATVNFGNNVLIGGPARDTLTGGVGRDLIIGNGAPSGQRDTEIGNAGEDTCIGLPGSTIRISCEHLLDKEPTDTCSCANPGIVPTDAVELGGDALVAVVDETPRSLAGSDSTLAYGASLLT